MNKTTINISPTKYNRVGLRGGILLVLFWLLGVLSLAVGQPLGTAPLKNLTNEEIRFRRNENAVYLTNVPKGLNDRVVFGTIVQLKHKEFRKTIGRGTVVSVTQATSEVRVVLSEGVEYANELRDIMKEDFVLIFFPDLVEQLYLGVLRSEGFAELLQKGIAQSVELSEPKPNFWTTQAPKLKKAVEDFKKLETLGEKTKSDWERLERLVAEVEAIIPKKYLEEAKLPQRQTLLSYLELRNAVVAQTRPGRKIESTVDLGPMATDLSLENLPWETVQRLGLIAGKFSSAGFKHENQLILQSIRRSGVNRVGAFFSAKTKWVEENSRAEMSAIMGDLLKSVGGADVEALDSLAIRALEKKRVALYAAISLNLDLSRGNAESLRASLARLDSIESEFISLIEPGVVESARRRLLSFERLTEIGKSSSREDELMEARKAAVEGGFPVLEKTIAGRLAVVQAAKKKQDGLLAQKKKEADDATARERMAADQSVTRERALQEMKAVLVEVEGKKSGMADQNGFNMAYVESALARLEKWRPDFTAEISADRVLGRDFELTLIFLRVEKDTHVQVKRIVDGYAAFISDLRARDTLTEKEAASINGRLDTDLKNYTEFLSRHEYIKTQIDEQKKRLGARVVKAKRPALKMQ